MRLIPIAIVAAVLTIPSLAQAADPNFNAAFSSKSGHTGCEVRAYPKGRVWVMCAQQTPTHPGDYDEKIAYMTLHKHGMASKQVGGFGNLEWTAAKVRYGKWLWVAKMATPGARSGSMCPAAPTTARGVSFAASFARAG